MVKISRKIASSGSLSCCIGKGRLVGIVTIAFVIGLVLNASSLSSLIVSQQTSLTCSCGDSGTVETVARASSESSGHDDKSKERIWCSLYGKVRKFQAYRQCTNCTSQYNQDNILRRIFDTIGTTNRHCVEFGFGYQSQAGNDQLSLDDFREGAKMTSGLNTHALIAEGWTPTFFDAEISNPKINLVKRVLTTDNIGTAFKDAGVPMDVDYVSIDVDSIDVWLFLGLLSSGYRPRVVSVEYNSNFPINMLLSCEKKWAPWRPRSRVYGSSAAAINMVAEMYGYQVVEIMPTLDIFFVRKDVLHAKCKPESLASFGTLAEAFVGQPAHKTCTSCLAWAP